MWNPFHSDTSVVLSYSDFGVHFSHPTSLHLVGIVSEVANGTITIVDNKGNTFTIELPEGAPAVDVGAMVTSVGRLNARTGQFESQAVEKLTQLVQRLEQQIGQLSQRVQELEDRLAQQQEGKKLEKLQRLFEKNADTKLSALEDALERIEEEFRAKLDQALKEAASDLSRVADRIRARPPHGNIEGNGLIVIRVTDPPAPEVDECLVTLSSIEIDRAKSGEESPWITIVDEPVTFDLTELEELEEFLGNELVEPGLYTQIRMHVDSVTLVVDSEEQPARIPNEKIQIVRLFQVVEGEETALLLDIDGEDSLVVTGQGEFIFTPLAKLSLLYVGGFEEPEFEGTIDAVIDANTWTMTIDGETVTVDVSGADIDGIPAEGLVVEIEGSLVDGTIIATEVEIKAQEFEGTIDTIDGTTWTMTIDGETVTVDVSGADIDGVPTEGLVVEVEGFLVDGTIIATEVDIEAQKFEGTIDTIDGTTWTMTIDGETVTVDVSGADIDGVPAEGLVAEVEGALVDGTIIATEVEIEEPEEEEHEGTIDAIDGDIWIMTIDGQTVTVDVSGADIDGVPTEGLVVEIEGFLVGGIIVATEVDIEGRVSLELQGLEENQEFEGTIDSIDGTTWTMTIDGETVTVDVSGADIDGVPDIGLVAQVEGSLVEGTIIATEVDIEEQG